MTDQERSTPDEPMGGSVNEALPEVRTKARAELADYVQAGLTVLVAIVVVLAALQLPGSGTSITPGTFPVAAGAVLAVLGVLLVIFPSDTQGLPGPRALLRVFRTFGLVVGFTILLPIIGFTASTVLFLVAILVSSREWRPLTVVALPVVSAVVLFILFYSLLGISLPVTEPELLIDRSF